MATRPGRDEAREIVDMAVGMVVEQAVAEPHDARRAEVAPEPRLDLVLVEAGVAVGVEQALLGGQEHCRVPSPSIAPPSSTQSALA